jgi:hypothetical protein
MPRKRKRKAVCEGGGPETPNWGEHGERQHFGRQHVRLGVKVLMVAKLRDGRQNHRDNWRPLA